VPDVTGKLHAKWYTQWLGSATSKLQAVRTEPGKKTPHCNLNRRQQVIITRLRTGHSNLTHTLSPTGRREPTGQQHTWYTRHYKARPDWLTAVNSPQQDKSTEFRWISKQHPTAAPSGSGFYSSWKTLACMTGYDILPIQCSRGWFATP
jgi:hypothetical protein